MKWSFNNYHFSIFHFKHGLLLRFSSFLRLLLFICHSLFESFLKDWLETLQLNCHLFPITIEKLIDEIGWKLVTGAFDLMGCLNPQLKLRLMNFFFLIIVFCSYNSSSPSSNNAAWYSEVSKGKGGFKIIKLLSKHWDY